MRGLGLWFVVPSRLFSPKWMMRTQVWLYSMSSFQVVPFPAGDSIISRDQMKPPEKSPHLLSDVPPNTHNSMSETNLATGSVPPRRPHQAGGAESRRRGRAPRGSEAGVDGRVLRREASQLGGLHLSVHNAKPRYCWGKLLIKKGSAATATVNVGMYVRQLEDAVLGDSLWHSTV